MEEHRLQQSDKYEVHWKRWGPYVSERQWVCLNLPTMMMFLTLEREMWLTERVPFVKTIRPMVTRGTASPSRWPRVGRIDGAKMVLLVSREFWAIYGRVIALQQQLTHRDNHQRLCFTLGLWNGKDPILKERLYGLNGSQGLSAHTTR